MLVEFRAQRHLRQRVALAMPAGQRPVGVRVEEGDAPMGFVPMDRKAGDRRRLTRTTLGGGGNQDPSALPRHCYTDRRLRRGAKLTDKAKPPGPDRPAAPPTKSKRTSSPRFAEDICK